MKGILGSRVCRKFRLLPACMLITLTMLLSACSGGGEDSPPSGGGGGGTTSQIEVRDMGNINLPADTMTELTPLEVQGGTASFMLVADGGNSAANIDIEELIDPTGKVLVGRHSTSVDPIGRNGLQLFGDTLATGLFPHTPHYPIPAGTYKFRVASHDAPSTVRVHAIINHRKNPTGGTLDVNLIFCGIPDLNASNAHTNQNFQVLFNEFKRIYAQANIQVNVAGTFNCNQADAARLTFLNIVNEEFGDLLVQSSMTGNQALNFFFVQGFEGITGVANTLGIAGKIAGPALIQEGTRYSGVVVSTQGGGLSGLSQADLLEQGTTMAHEGGHFLGLYHTTEKCGAGGSFGNLDAFICFGLDAQLYGYSQLNSWDRVDPIQDTPECPAPLIGTVSVNDCLDGKNLMFWTAPPRNINANQPDIIQDHLTAGQKFVLHRSPYVH